MEVRTSINPEERLEHRLKPYVKKYEIINGIGIYQLNPNKYDEHGFLKSFSAFLETMKKIFKGYKAKIESADTISILLDSD